jgi:pimeloyl-ACP methyl ester carboxylesterase/class 3 adenylate cyclase
MHDTHASFGGDVVTSTGTRFAQSGEVRIAYQVFGDGPSDIVFIPGFVSHQDFLHDLALYRGLFERFGAFARVITFDKRGTGASDRTLGLGTAEERMDDIRAVMEATGSERAALIGLSEGGPLALLFAATYPERVTALVAWGTFARLTEAPDYPVGVPLDVVRAFNEAVRDAWGTGRALRHFIRKIPADDAAVGRYERAACSPSGVLEVLNGNTAIDVRAALPAISAPTLVLHRTGDPLLPVGMGRCIAESIDGAQFVELPGAFHANGAIDGEADSLDVIEEFLTGQRPRRATSVDRVLATVLFTDIVGSTERAAELGDVNWRALLDEFRARVRTQLAGYRGREVNTRGDDFLAIFDGPGRAVECAHAIHHAVRRLGIEVRSGLHTGEVELQGDDIAGIAVHIGARVAALAGPGEVLVTSTVRDLVVGSSLTFTDERRSELKGVPGEWTILRAPSARRA